MRDISRRLKRYRLSRYAPPVDPVRRHFKWVWLAGAAWAIYAGFISDHSMYRIWKLEHEEQVTTTELVSADRARETMEEESRDPAAQRFRIERVLREKSGMARRNEIVYVIRKVPADSLGH